jgi:hypothetical protein
MIKTLMPFLFLSFFLHNFYFVRLFRAALCGLFLDLPKCGVALSTFQSRVTLLSSYPIPSPGQRNDTFLTFSLIIEGTTEKAFYFIILLELIYNKNFGFIYQKCLLEHYKKNKTEKNSLK